VGAVAIVLHELAGAPEPELRARLGPELDDEVRRVLRVRALDWARRTGADDGARGRPLELARADQLAAALTGHDGPVLLVAPDVPGLSEIHRDGALDDLRAGVLLSSAASGDGTPFLVALSRPKPELLAVIGGSFEEVGAAAVALGGELGMLRTERRLTTVADARAVLADPLAPAELRALLAALR
jgi:hypothetical protein